MLRFVIKKNTFREQILAPAPRSRIRGASQFESTYPPGEEPALQGEKRSASPEPVRTYIGNADWCVWRKCISMMSEDLLSPASNVHDYNLLSRIFIFAPVRAWYKHSLNKVIYIIKYTLSDVHKCSLKQIQSQRSICARYRWQWSFLECKAGAQTC